MALVRTQIQLDRRLYRELRREAHERGISMSAVLRELLGERYTPAERTTIRDPEAALRMIGAFSDEATDVAERHDDYLYGDDG